MKNISAPHPAAGEVAGQYGGGIIITPEYKPAAGIYRSPGAPSARRTSPPHFPAVGPAAGGIGGIPPLLAGFGDEGAGDNRDIHAARSLGGR